MAGDGETVEAHFFGRTSMAVLESVDAFARKTGLALVEARLVGTFPLDQECHRVTFRVPPAGGPAAPPEAAPANEQGSQPVPPESGGERTVAEACAGLVGVERDVCIFAKSRGRPVSLTEVARHFPIPIREAAAIFGRLEARGVIKSVPAPGPEEIERWEAGREEKPPETGGPGQADANRAARREKFREKVEEINRRLQEDPEFRRRFLEDPVEARLDRLIQINEEIAEMLKGSAGGSEPPAGPVDLPEGPMFLGRVAGTEIPFEWDPMDLKTHCLIAGQEGSGTSTAASIIVEEALRNRVPVVCFDPTDWWTGLLRPNRDPETIQSHPRLGMRIEDARPFNGTIHEVTDPNARIDLKRHLHRGEVTIFTLDKLRPGELDQAVMSVIDSMFQMQWKESIDLELLVVFDEIHRLLEKHGGHGGYTALVKGAREFRKWGVGMVMVGRSLTDLPSDLRSNVLTEIQFRTRNPADIDRIKSRFGEEYGDVIPELETGEALVAHPKYNRGKPVTVRFRPPRHRSGKLPEKDLETHRTFVAGLEGAERALAGLRKNGVDTTELELEVNLVRSKVAEGRFRMAEVYLESLRTSMERFGGKGAARRGVR